MKWFAFPVLVVAWSAVVLLTPPAFAQPTCTDVAVTVVPPDPDVAVLTSIAVRKHYNPVPSHVVQCTDTTGTWWVLAFDNKYPVKPPATLTFFPANNIKRLMFKKNARTLMVFETSVSFRVRLDANGNALRTWVFDANGKPIRQVFL